MSDDESGVRAAASVQLTHAPNRRIQLATLLGLAVYLSLTHVLMGLRTEHFVLATIFVALAVRGGRALDFLIRFLPVVLTGITYDFFRIAVPLRGDIHVADLYEAELAWFGIGGQIPAAWFEQHTHAALDFTAGLSYIVYLYVPMVTAIALYWLDRERMVLVGWAFLLTNLVGMVVYIAYPAAPPWYVAEHGLGPVVLDAAPSAAGAARFDALVGLDFFANFYKRSANVFGAMPSLHVAYPASTLLAMWDCRRWSYPLAAFVALVSFAAVYLQHHYIWDVLAGVLCAAIGYILARAVLQRRREVAHA